MIIKLIQANKLKISLTEDDLLSLGITYEALDYVNPKTRSVVTNLLRTARAQTGFTPGYDKLLIEAYQSDEGCVLYFTALTQREKETQCTTEPVIFEFANVELLLQGCCKLHKQYSHKIFKSTAYSMAEKYYLILYSLDGSESIISNFLQEFSRKIAKGRLADSFLDEHANCIVKDNALDVFAEHFAA